jgi:hypothetical protein
MRLHVEECERRVLPSAITDVMAANSLRAHGSPSVGLSRTLTAAAGSAGAAGFMLSPTSVALPSNQGPPPFGTNLALTQTGTLTHHEIRRQKFTARFAGPYTIGSGRTSTEALQTFIRGAGTTNTMLHADIQLLIITPKDPTVQLGGVSAIFDRNLNSNTALGFDVSAPQQNVDSAGRPNHFDSVAIDPNLSAGVYDEAFSQGVINIRYIPNSKRSPGVIEQGKAVVTIHAQIYTANVGFILRNADINP